MRIAAGVGVHLAACSGMEDFVYGIEGSGLGSSSHLPTLESIIELLGLLVLAALFAKSCYQVCILHFKLVLINLHG